MHDARHSEGSHGDHPILNSVQRNSVFPLCVAVAVPVVVVCYKGNAPIMPATWPSLALIRLITAIFLIFTSVSIASIRLSIAFFQGSNSLIGIAPWQVSAGRGTSVACVHHGGRAVTRYSHDEMYCCGTKAAAVAAATGGSWHWSGTASMLSFYPWPGVASRGSLR